MSPIPVRDEGSTFTPAPHGTKAAICCDVADLGYLQTQFGEKRKVRIYWMLHDKMDDGRPFMVSQQYTLSLNEKSNLSKDLTAWWGRAITVEERKAGFDLEDLIGQPAFLSVIHNEKDGKTYANVNSIMPLPEGTVVPQIPGDFVRWIDREGNSPRPPSKQPNSAPKDDEVPF